MEEASAASTSYSGRCSSSPRPERQPRYQFGLQETPGSGGGAGLTDESSHPRRGKTAVWGPNGAVAFPRRGLEGGALPAEGPIAASEQRENLNPQLTISRLLSQGSIKQQLTWLSSQSLCRFVTISFPSS